MNREGLIEVLHLTGNQEQDTEKVFCACILRHCSTYVVNAILKDYNKINNMLAGREEEWKP